MFSKYYDKYNLKIPKKEKIAMYQNKETSVALRWIILKIKVCINAETQDSGEYGANLDQEIRTTVSVSEM